MIVSHDDNDDDIPNNGRTVERIDRRREDGDRLINGLNHC